MHTISSDRILIGPSLFKSVWPHVTSKCQITVFFFAVDMDLLQELENMVTNIEDECGPNDKPAEDEIAIWQKLFSYSYNEAIEHITNQRNDFSRCRVSGELWPLLQSEKEAQGYSREAFEHEIRSRSNKAIPPQPRPLANDNSASRAESTYLILLTGPIANAQQIESIASLTSPPSTCSASSEDTGSSHLFCHIDASTKEILHNWFKTQHPSFAPTFVRVSQARKDLASTSLYPTLGIDSTLPQRRFDTLSLSPSPAQDEYPVTYFFYGTLADPDFLRQLLALPEGEEVVVKPAHVKGGMLKTWGGMYTALVDGGEGDVVEGRSYVVENREREEVLRVYETGVYEAVRCWIVVEGGGMVRGLTFRFVG